MDLLKAIRADNTAAPANTAVIVTSGDYRREDESMALGADHFLLKPYPPNTLSEIITKILSKGAASE